MVIRKLPPAIKPPPAPPIIKAQANEHSPQPLKKTLSAETGLQQTLLGNAFKAYSLLGQSDQLEANATQVKALFGLHIMSGQATMIYADPNAGKTLTLISLALDKVAKGQCDPDRIIYINADDNSSGLVTKNGIFENLGIHMLVPGFNGMTVEKVEQLMLKCVEDDTAKGIILIIDTMKKFTDLMDKKRTSRFGQTTRAFVAKGGTVIGLGHTTKNPNADGTPRYQGTTDIIEDFDAVYVGKRLAPKNPNRQVAGVTFTRIKSRSDSPESVSYAFSTEQGISYEEKLASVTFLESSDLADYILDQEKDQGTKVGPHLFDLIREGEIHGKMALARAASERAKASIKAAIHVLEHYTGSTPGQHLWNFRKGDRGVQIYELLPPPAA